MESLYKKGNILKKKDFHFHNIGDKLLVQSIFHCQNSTLEMIQHIENERGKTIHPVDDYTSPN